MIRDAFVKCGVIGWPLLLVSISLFGLIFAKLITLFFHKRIQGLPFSHKELIEPLAGVAVSLGLLGTVTGFISAFSAWTSKFEPMVLISGIYEAFYTTMVGLILSITTMIACYLFDNISGTGKEQGSVIGEREEVPTIVNQSASVQRIEDDLDFVKITKLVRDKIANKEKCEAFLVAYKSADKECRQRILNDLLKNDFPVSVEVGLV